MRDNVPVEIAAIPIITMSKAEAASLEMTVYIGQPPVIIETPTHIILMIVIISPLNAVQQ
jgi:hypothetical protein